MPYKKRLQIMLSKGYFPKELPPSFTTVNFGNNILEILREWELNDTFSRRENLRHNGSRKNGSYNYRLNYSEPEIISKPKRGYERRNIHLTHPVCQALLSYELSVGWISIQKWLSRKRYTIDRIALSEKFDRGIDNINFDTHRTKKAFIEASSNWVVSTDISRFYPTIYTHSLPWAAYGKEKVKANLRLYEGALADRIDALVRASNRNQTVGIPIGPETSRIIAEIISSRIDSDFAQLCPATSHLSIDRLQDDWYVGASSLEDAEKILSRIALAYRNYGLEINGSKTSVERVLGVSSSEWVSELGAFLSHGPGPLRGPKLKELLALSLRLQAAHPTEPVISYTLSVIEGQRFSPSEAETLESFLLKSALVAPVAMDSIARILINLQHTTRRLSLRRIADRFTRLAEMNIEKGNIYEVIWLLYTIRGFRMGFNSRIVCSAIENLSSSALALILLDMSSKGSCAQRLPVDNWARAISIDRINSDWIWLLAYEGIRQNWLPDRKNVMASPLFSPLVSHNIAFYDPNRNVRRSESMVRARRITRRRMRIEARAYIERLRGFEFGEY